MAKQNTVLTHAMIIGGGLGAAAWERRFQPLVGGVPVHRVVEAQDVTFAVEPYS